MNDTYHLANAKGLNELRDFKSFIGKPSGSGLYMWESEGSR